ncbi:MAG TPA: protein kinase [Pirellulales bacterium]|nr:protein kinase [Pirellulales bacterium]
MAELSAEQIAQRAFDLDLIDQRSLQAVLAETRNLEPAEFQQLLMRRELLTAFQLERLLRGERSGFFYGKYKVLYQVGAGTFARVHRAVHRETGQVVAVKVLRNRFNGDAAKRDQFFKEAEVGQTLRHPNIVAIYEVASEKLSPYMVMEFVEGQTLRNFLKNRKQIAPVDAVRLMADIARGLDHAFRRGISHRDLKSSNVLVSSAGHAKLVDFGLAGIDPDVSDEALAGTENPRTLDYVALERASNVHKDDNRSDIFFAGCIYYHMLSGKPALEETRDRMQRLNPTRFFDISPLKRECPDLPRPLASVVDKAMELDVKMRYQTPGEVLADLNIMQQRIAEGQSLDNAAIGVKQRSLMIVEPSPRIQDVLRTQLKQSGYRVLVTSDPQRPFSGFAAGAPPADCVLFCTSNLGETALDAFNRFGQHTSTARVAAVLLLGSKQGDWSARAKTSPLHAVVNSPFTVQQLRELIERVLGNAEPAEKQ